MCNFVMSNFFFGVCVCVCTWKKSILRKKEKVVFPPSSSSFFHY